MTMQSRFAARIAMLGLCLAFASSAYAQTSGRQAAALGRVPAVAGSYLIENLTIPNAGLESLQALASLTTDGVAIVTDTDDFGLAATAPHSPKLGSWKRTGRRDIALVVLEFAYDNAGNHIFTWRLELAGTFEDNRFDSGTGTLVAKLFPPVAAPGLDPLDSEAVPLVAAAGTFDFRRIRP